MAGGLKAAATAQQGRGRVQGPVPPNEFDGSRTPMSHFGDSQKWQKEVADEGYELDWANHVRWY